MLQKALSIPTRGRETHDITAAVAAIVDTAAIETGLCHVFIQHTSASLMICENADPAVRHDLETFIAGLVLDNDPRFTHTQEGADDMSAHIRSVLTQSALSLPITDGRLGLGTWQGIYLWEHRYNGYLRHLIVTVDGDA